MDEESGFALFWIGCVTIATIAIAVMPYLWYETENNSTASEIELLLRSEGSGIDEIDQPSNSNEAGADFPSSSPLPSSRYILYLEFEVALLPLVP
jgi:hypothetical protein